MRNIVEVVDKIITVIDEKCDFNEERIVEIIEQLEGIKNDSRYRAPELTYIDWNNLAGILNTYFIPENSKWETEIMVIFNDLPGTAEDYWDGD